MKRFLTVSAALVMTSSAALAGGLQDPVVEPAPAAPPPPVQTISGDWTGFYAGGQLGYGDVDGSGAADGDDILYGVHAGYDYDFGSIVLGGELDYDFADIDLNGAADVDSVARLKIRAGYDLGNTLIYLAGGAAQVDTSLGNETGEFYGAGLAYRVSEQFTVGGEILEHSFDDINGSGVDADATTLTLRGSYRF